MWSSSVIALEHNNNLDSIIYARPCFALEIVHELTRPNAGNACMS